MKALRIANQGRVTATDLSCTRISLFDSALFYVMANKNDFDVWKRR
jgi:hypothetical protein